MPSAQPMTDDILDYSKLIEEAMFHVVRRALAIVAEHGLPGRHLLYITFRTSHPGVALSDPMIARYPEQITIVLEHKFWGLEVFDDRFEVNLSFSGIEERVVVPFAAITAFADPGVKFGLQFGGEAVPQDKPGADPAPAPTSGGGAGEVVALDAFRKK